MDKAEIPKDELLRSFGVVLQGALSQRANLMGQILELDRVILDANRSQASQLAKARYTLADHCEEALREAGRPLKVEDLPLGPSGSTRTRFVILHRESRFEHLGWSMWALREWSEEIKAPHRRKRKS